ncbi:MAG: hypothetical protein DHS20C15_29350 [Planctomycetota bacterium]|nr:MAG: hypothetical protein DHS20C15_29350 [Planctomycetota bacterium]
MFKVKILCPSTQQPVDTGIATSQQSWESTSATNNRVRCPHCSETHTWDKPDAFLEGVSAG